MNANRLPGFKAALQYYWEGFKRKYFAPQPGIMDGFIDQVAAKMEREWEEEHYRTTPANPCCIVTVVNATPEYRGGTFVNMDGKLMWVKPGFSNSDAPNMTKISGHTPHCGCMACRMVISARRP